MYREWPELSPTHKLILSIPIHMELNHMMEKNHMELNHMVETKERLHLEVDHHQTQTLNKNLLQTLNLYHKERDRGTKTQSRPTIGSMMVEEVGVC